MRLTNREMHVLKILREGASNKRIAHELGISECTIKIHIRNMFVKTNATNRTQLALMDLKGNQ
jgi:DNA-binding NarL/FixJ family response regulator